MSALVRTAWRNGHLEQQAVVAAAAALRSGAVVAMPTETVYGLAALARDPHAVRRVFTIKGRPLDHPVIVHVDGANALPQWGVRIPGYAFALAEALWPGPLTLVVPAAADVARYLTGGQDTVGLRCPAHPVALALIEAAGPVAAPSANRFGRVSPVTADDVVTDLGDRLAATDVVLDGGPCPVGVESTILDCTGPAPRILRWGAVEPAEVHAAAGVTVDAGASSVRAPGGLASHYAPRATVHLHGDPIPGAGLLALAHLPTPPGVQRLASPTTTREFAAVLYRALRDADALGIADLWVVTPSDESALSRAIRDRVGRAAVR
jgi:L-threonylcarbamoyladenylate synthase